MKEVMMPALVEPVEIAWRLLQDANDTVGNETSSNDEDAVIYDDSQVLRDTFVVYGSIMVVIILLFCWARRRFPNVYNIRNWVEHLKSPLAADPYGFFSWIWKVYLVTEDELLDECGLDAVCFVRISQMGYKMACVGMFNAIFLMITYALSDEEKETENIDDGIVEVTIAHVPEESMGLIATTLAAYIFFGYAMKLILEELEWFIEMRHKFLKKPKARNYSVFIRNIPSKYRNNQALYEFMESCFSHDAVLEAHVIVTSSQLAKTQANRDGTLDKLEHALAEYSITGQRPQHKNGGMTAVVGMGETVDSIETYKTELVELNKQVNEGMDGLQEKIQAMSTALELGTQSVALRSFDNDEITSLVPHEQQQETADDNDTTKSSTGGKLGLGTVTGALGNVTNVATGALGNVTNVATSAAGGVVGGAANLATSAVNLVSGTEDGVAHPSGFVTFAKLSTASAALQMVHHPQPFTMEVMEAPDPDDINWVNIARKHKDLQVGALLSLGITVTICLLWTIPMAFIASLSTVEGLREDIEFIDDMLDAAPFLVPVFEIAAPFFVIAVNSLLPIILEAVSLLEGPISGAVLEASLFVKLAAFMIIQTFFVSAISGSVIDKISEMIDDPTMIVELLATSLPQQATYFMQISIVSLVVSGGIEILRLIPIGMAIARSFIGPRLTEKEQRTTFLGLRPLYDPLEFQHADFESNAVFYFMVLFVYSCISPLTNFIVAFVFLGLQTLLRHQFVYIYPTVPDSGGKMFENFIKIMVTCMIIAEITLLGLLGLKKASVASPLFIPLLVITILFSYYIRQEHFHVAEFLPTRTALQQDVRRPLEKLEFLKDSYLQPELKVDRDVWPDMLSDENPYGQPPTVEEGTDDPLAQE